MSLDTLLPVAQSLMVDRPDSRKGLPARLAGFVTLTKPRIAVMVLLTVAVGFVLGARGSSHPRTLALALIGTGLVAAGASAWNQVLERDRDARMKRTARRPLPSGLLGIVESSL